jgi:hypothetical protein
VSTLQRVCPGERDIEFACGATDVKRRKPIETGRKQSILRSASKKRDIHGLSFDYLPALASRAKEGWIFFGCWSLVIGVSLELGCWRLELFYIPQKNTRTNADKGEFIRIPLSKSLQSNLPQFLFIDASGQRVTFHNKKYID